MARNFFAKIRFLALILGAIATSSILNACSTAAQNQAQAPSPAATDAGAMQGMDHSNMGGMNHGMALGPANAEFDLRFIDAMTPHHQGAVEMAKEAQQKSERPEIQKLAADIIQAQNTEIDQMKQWRQAWYPTASAEPVAYNSQMGHSMPMSKDQRSGMMMSMDLGAADDQFDLRFIDAMIPHHQGAVVMANDALSKSQRSEVRQLAQEIIVSQQAEIDQMKQWRTAWYNQ
jgi:uncharacterized protein (DUF305 family)